MNGFFLPGGEILLAVDEQVAISEGWTMAILVSPFHDVFEFPLLGHVGSW